jgi:hypothetical protein
LTVREIGFFFNKELTDKLMGVKKTVWEKKIYSVGATKLWLYVLCSVNLKGYCLPAA